MRTPKDGMELNKINKVIVYAHKLAFDNYPTGSVESMEYSVIKALELNGFKIIPRKIEKSHSRLYLPIKMIKEMINMFSLAKSSRVMLFYPGVPLVPLTSNIKIPIALLLYFIFFKINKLLNNKIITIVVDLPIEQDELLGNYNIKINKRYYRLFERLIFKNSDRIIVFSHWFEENIKKFTNSQKINILVSRIFPYIAHQNDLKGDQKIDWFNKIRSGYKIIAFYTGELRRAYEKEMIKKVIRIINKKNKEVALVVCGIGGEWLNMETGEVYYMGYVSKPIHDYFASRSDFGLILYPNKGYYKVTPTQKYTTYISNGLPIIALYSETVALNINKDGSGLIFNNEDFEFELSKFLSDINILKEYKKKLLRLKNIYNDVSYINDWV
jgi:hypothetical protein